MASTSRVKTWISGDTLTASDLNAEFDNLLTGGINNIENANVASGAAIATSKIAGTAATLSGTETFANKTLTKPIIDASVQGTASYTPSAVGTATLDCSSDNVHLITMPAGNITIALSNVTAGQFFFIRILQDSGGSRTVTWFSTITWAGSAAPTLTTTASKADLFAFFAKTGSTFDGFKVGQNIG